MRTDPFLTNAAGACRCEPGRVTNRFKDFRQDASARFRFTRTSASKSELGRRCGTGALTHMGMHCAAQEHVRMCCERGGLSPNSHS